MRRSVRKSALDSIIDRFFKKLYLEIYSGDLMKLLLNTRFIGIIIHQYYEKKGDME